MSNENVVVKFTQSWRGYSKGESAGFNAEQAKSLIDGKAAEAVKAKGKPGKAADKPSDKPADQPAEKPTEQPTDNADDDAKP